MNEGGKVKPDAMSTGAAYGMMLSGRIKIPMAMLLGIPNQPLFEGKKEDGLIAETFVKYLETGDESWPLLFPMVKSVIKAMDAIQEFSEKEMPKKVTRFVLSGGSKRGWNTYLTAANDSRVTAIAPLVFDSLNMAAQLPHQKEIYGGYSEMIKDYTNRGLVPMPDSANARKLWSWVDPWTYRDKLTVPKMILAGNNDPYWNTDALNLYWDGLPSQKWIGYIPNAGHGLEEKSAGGGKGNRFRVLNDLCAFVRHQATGEKMPEVSWLHDDAPDGQLRLTVTTNPKPATATIWSATADGRDFRQSTWKPTSIEVPADGKIIAQMPKPESGGQAFYVDCGYKIEDITYSLCTQMRVIEVKKTAAN
jgi:PhoPQ-activated pathogenicity-related protein